MEWVIECPREFDAIDITADGNLDDGVMTVEWRGYEGYVPLTGYVSSRFVADAGRAVVSLSGSSNCRGVTMHYECTTLSASTPFELLTSSSGIVMSDADGASSDTYYNAVGLSQWLVSCPETTRYIELNATSFLGEHDKLTVVPIRDELPCVTDVTSFSGYRCWNLTVAANKTLLQLRGRSGGPGFTLHYMCVGDYPHPPAPGSPLVCGSTLTKPNGTLMSDPDGSGTSCRTPTRSAMEWLLVCPREFDAINITADGNLYDGVMNVTWRGYEGYVQLTGHVSRRFVADAGRAVVSLLSASFLLGRGITLRYECTVWSGSTPFGVTKLTSPSGVVMSDADGASSDTYYTADSLARWLVSCPETTRYIELNATSFLGEDDELTVVPIRDEMPHLADVTSFFGYRCWNLTVTANKALLQLRGRSGGPGFTLHYTCVGDYPRPPAPGNPLVCGSTLTTPNGTLMSDPDGSDWDYKTDLANAVDWVHSSMEWVIECPREFNAMSITVDGNLDAGVMTVTWRGYEGYVPLTADVSSRFIADAGRAVVSLSAGSYSCQGITLRYECTVRSGSTPFELTKLTSPSGVVMSDADGASSDTYYSAGSLARWLVSCPETTRYIELNATSFLGEHDKLTVVPIRDELPCVTDVTSFSGYRCWNLTVAANKTLLQLRGRSGGPGFTLHYMCVGDYPHPPAPGSPLVCGSTLTKPNGTLMSDPDGSGTSCSTPSRSSMEWVLECPHQFNAINITVEGYVDNGFLTVAWRGYEGYFPLTGDVSSRFVADAGRAIVSLETGWRSCLGITLSYECTMQSGGTPFALTKLTLPSGIVMSDADGASSNTYYSADNLPRWLVSCPETTRYIELNATSFLGEGDELTVVPIRDELPHLADLTSFSGYRCWNLTVAANKTLLQLRGRSGGPGFTLHYMCVGDYPRPPAPGSPLVCGSTLTKPNGTLMSDPDGSGSARTTQPRSSIAWVLECPHQFNAINITVEGYLDNGVLTVAWRGYEGYFPLTGDVSSRFVADAGRAVVTLSTGSSYCRGITLHYECTTVVRR